jgi:SpoVK/Ycf46/Vps4 family AAA+-type ATPase
MGAAGTSRYRYRHYREKRSEERERVGAAIDARSVHEAYVGYVQLAHIERGLAAASEGADRRQHRRHQERYREAAAVLKRLLGADRPPVDPERLFASAAEVAREVGDRASATDRLAKMLIAYHESLNDAPAPGADGRDRPTTGDAGPGRSTADGSSATGSPADTDSGSADAGTARSEGRDGSRGDDAAGIDDVDDEIVEFEDDVPVTFDDVGGYADVKAELREQVVERVEKRHLYEAGDFSVGGGVMLVGPPGTGKTLMARAVCGEADWSLGYVGCSDATSALFGKSAKRIGSIFDQAKRRARDRPVLLFFDEIDTLAPDRSGDVGTAAGNDQMVTAFLTEMNDLAEEDHDLIVVGASNTPDAVDAAVIDNAQRMRTVIEMGLPDRAAREEIFRVHLQAPGTAPDVDPAALADHTEGFSGSEIESVVAAAYATVVGDTPADAAPDAVEPITQDHLLAAVDDVADGADGHRSYL